MYRTKLATGFALATLFAVSAFAPMAASADNWHQNQPRQQQNLQNQKNDYRNAAIGAGALGVIGLLTHNNTLAVLGGVGAAVSASQYEQDRHIQSEEQNDCRDRGYVAYNNGDRHNGFNNGWRR